NMTALLSRRFLINLLLVGAAVGANGFVAFTQIAGQRQTADWLAHSLRAKRDLEAYRTTLIDDFVEIELFRDDGTPPDPALTARRATQRRALLDDLLQLAGPGDRARTLLALGSVTGDWDAAMADMLERVRIAGGAAGGAPPPASWLPLVYRRLEGC